ncbi:MAG: hypothetical protein GTO22_03885 [Gemmatimonadales bacterium]|nr:hypothetical protein [Gemmatimonadales bacterium]
MWYGEDGSVYKLREGTTDKEGRAVFDTASKEGQYFFTAKLPEGIVTRRLRTFPGHPPIITVFKSSVAGKPSVISGIDVGLLALGTLSLAIGMPRHDKPLGVLATSMGVIAIVGTTIDVIKKAFA